MNYCKWKGCEIKSDKNRMKWINGNPSFLRFNVGCKRDRKTWDALYQVQKLCDFEHNSDIVGWVCVCALHAQTSLLLPPLIVFEPKNWNKCKWVSPCQDNGKRVVFYFICIIWQRQVLTTKTICEWDDTHSRVKGKCSKHEHKCASEDEK